LSSYPKEHDNDLIAEHFKVWKENKSEDILTYRDHCFKSVNDGHMAINHVLPWFKSFDDSLEGYINQTEKNSSSV